MGSVKQAEFGESVLDVSECLLGFVWVLPAGNHEFATAEEEDDDIGIVKAVDEPGELFGSFVFS